MTLEDSTQQPPANDDDDDDEDDEEAADMEAFEVSGMLDEEDKVLEYSVYQVLYNYLLT